MMKRQIEFNNVDRLIELGLTIAALRKLRGLSQDELAEKANISRSHLSQIETPSVAKAFTVDVLFSIADALGVRAGDLLNNTLPGMKE